MCSSDLWSSRAGSSICNKKLGALATINGNSTVLELDDDIVLQDLDLIDGHGLSKGTLCGWIVSTVHIGKIYKEGMLLRKTPKQTPKLPDRSGLPLALRNRNFRASKYTASLF